MLEKYLNLLEELRLLGEQVPTMIAEMPDNPRIKRVGDGNCIEFMEFAKKIAIENEDFDFSILGESDAREYIEEYCDNLHLVER